MKTSRESVFSQSNSPRSATVGNTHAGLALVAGLAFFLALKLQNKNAPQGGAFCISCNDGSEAFLLCCLLCLFLRCLLFLGSHDGRGEGINSIKCRKNLKTRNQMGKRQNKIVMRYFSEKNIF
jgi:hypothetical protein